MHFLNLLGSATAFAVGTTALNVPRQANATSILTKTFTETVFVTAPCNVTVPISTEQPAQTTAPPVTSCTPSPSRPSPIQPGAVCNCFAWHYVRSDDNCWELSQRYGIAEAQIRAWNTEVGPSCEIWSDYFVCIGA
ncbi:hypothetical protein QBC40DRAFT_301745 [Triangularia verruculosa]|uniref:LysM domain-containing protein n=1 Tax=Triangularia verruculosa TaxID=2587418 RepID=A0AAN6X6G6_9PEZI|nr:hypothetical protein QBC40DRAFT_301745 [Triangularia verruculosa]